MISLKFQFERVRPMKSNGIFQINVQIFTFLLLLIIACFLSCSDSENGNSATSGEKSVSMKQPGDIKFKYPSFAFVRIRYSGNETGPSSWATDYPESDLNFSARFREVTGLPADPNGKVMQLTDADLSQYPFIYMAEPGSLLLSEEEVASLRRYLLVVRTASPTSSAVTYSFSPDRPPSTISAPS